MDNLGMFSIGFCAGFLLAIIGIMCVLLSIKTKFDVKIKKSEEKDVLTFGVVICLEFRIWGLEFNCWFSDI